jgi:hypothetical protein
VLPLRIPSGGRGVLAQKLRQRGRFGSKRAKRAKKRKKVHHPGIEPGTS